MSESLAAALAWKARQRAASRLIAARRQPSPELVSSKPAKRLPFAAREKHVPFRAWSLCARLTLTLCAFISFCSFAS